MCTRGFGERKSVAQLGLCLERVERKVGFNENTAMQREKTWFATTSLLLSEQARGRSRRHKRGRWSVTSAQRILGSFRTLEPCSRCRGPTIVSVLLFEPARALSVLLSRVFDAGDSQDLVLLQK